jgi:uncharacterized membrane protein HdeD (DUF308 family)
MITCWPLLRQLSVLALAVLIYVHLLGLGLIVWGVTQIAFAFWVHGPDPFSLVCRSR